MRNQVGTLLRSALMVGAIAAMVGCQASASIGGGAKEPEPAPQPEAKKEEPKPAAVEPEKPKMEFQMENGALKLPAPVVFKTGSAELDVAASEPVLDVVLKYLEAKPQVTKLRIEGHTDNVGKPDANMTLSKGRSMSVAKYLIGKGIKCERLVAVGFGDTKPIGDNKTEEGKAQNRRTAFVNAELNNKAIGGMPLDGGGQSSGDTCK